MLSFFCFRHVILPKYNCVFPEVKFTITMKTVYSITNYFLFRKLFHPIFHIGKCDNYLQF